MPKLILLCAAVMVLSLVQPASAQAIFDAGAWTEFYTYEVPDQDNPQIRSLQGVRLRGRNIGAPGLGFFFRGRVASDLSEKLATDPDFRVFGFYAEYLQKDKLTFRLGRQFVAAGIRGLTMDGGRIDLSPFSSFKLTGFAGGAPGPSFHDYDRIAQLDKRAVFGGQLQFNGIKDFLTTLSFLQRNENEEVDSQVGGADLTLKSGRFSEWAGLNYDFIFKRLRSGLLRSKLEIQGGHRVEFEYFYRRPSFELSDVFSVFRNEPFHQFRLSPMYKINQKIHLRGSLAHTIFDDDYNTRVTLGGAYNGQSLGVVYSNGYAGTRLGVYSFLFHEMSKKLRVYLNADMYNYKLDTEEDDTTPSVSTAFGALAKIFDNVNCRAELQLFSNHDFKYDTRFYIRIGYNFSSKFRTSGFGGGLIR